MASPAAILQVFVNANTKVASAQVAAFDRQLQTVGKTSAATGASMGKFTKGAAAAGAGIAAAGAVAVVAGKQLYDLGKQFDEAYDRIRVGTGATGRELEKLKGSFRDVAKNVPNEFEEVGTAIADLNTRLGLTGKPLERMAENMLHLSNITGDDLEGSIRGVAVAFNDFQVPIQRQERTLNGLFRLYQASGVSIQELATSVQRFGSPLRQLEFSLGESAAMFASFERAGVNTQTMMPGLRFAIRNLTQPSEELAAKLGQLGIEAGKPGPALREIFKLLGTSSNLSQVEKTGLAFEIFGGRAGPDMAEAIKQGRFELDKFLGIFRDNKGDSIRKAADESYDFSENVKILGNNLKIFLEPAANAVFVALDEVTRALNQGIKEMEGTSKKTTTLGTILKVISQIVYGAIKVFQIFFRTTKRIIEGIIQVVKGFVQMFKGSFQIVTGLLTGNWRKVWQGAKNVAGGALKSIVGAIKSVTAPVRSVFQGIFEIVKDKFRSAYVTAANFINKILEIVDSIPGIDVGRIGTASRTRGEQQIRGTRAGMQRGGYLMGGKPSGDSIPAMLERGEYVLNREAVKKVGLGKLDQLNFKNAPRFQQGGRVGMIDGGAVSRLVDHLPGVNAVKGAATLFGKGAKFFIDKLPKPDLPEPIKGLGPWIIDQVTEFIKNRVPKFLSGTAALGAAQGQIRQAMQLAVSKGLRITSGFPLGTPGVHSPNSYHYQYGRAFDASNGVNTPQMREYAIEAAARWGKNILELFYDPLGWYVKNGSRVSGSIGGHSDHVHTAMQRGGMVGGVKRMATGGRVVREAAPILTRRGFDHKATAGILGNAWGESSWNPGAVGMGGGGLFGFTTSPVSLADLQRYAASKGKPWTDVATQIKFMLGHGSPKGIAMKGPLNALDTIPATTEKFMTDWERPGIPRLSERIAGGFMASKIMRKMKLGRPGGKPAGPSKKQKKALGRISQRFGRYPGREAIRKLGPRIERMVEDLDIFEREVGADWSAAGSELDSGEVGKLVEKVRTLYKAYVQRRNLIVRAMQWLNNLIFEFEARINATNTGAVSVVNGRVIEPGKKWQIPGFKKGIKNAKGALRELRSERVNLEGLTGRGGLIGDTKFRLRELKSTPPTQAEQELNSLLRDQLAQTQRALAVSQAQMPVFQQFMPRFHQGGIVQGPTGAERPVMAQAGEGIFTRDQMRALGANNITVVIEDGAIDSNRIRVEVDGVIQEKVSTVRRQGSNRRFATTR